MSASPELHTESEKKAMAVNNDRNEPTIRPYGPTIRPYEPVPLPVLLPVREPHPPRASAAMDLAVIVEDDDGLSISLARPDGRMVARRRLPRARTCAEQAETVAEKPAFRRAFRAPDYAGPAGPFLELPWRPS